LDRQIGKRLGDAADDLGVDRLAGESTVQVHQMQPARAGFHPARSHR